MQGFTGIPKAINGFAVNAECGRSRHKITKILNRAELEYEFCSAGDAEPATMQIRKACAEYKPTDGFPHTFYKEVVSKVILYRDTHIEFKLQNGQIV